MVALQYFGIIPDKDTVFQVYMSGNHQVSIFFSNIVILYAVALISYYTAAGLKKQGGELRLQAANLEEREVRLKEVRDEARKTNKAKSLFLANMSHEIRTPINGVIGMTDLILGTKLDEEQLEYAMTVRTSADSLLFLINDILDFSKIEAGQLNLEVLDFDLKIAVEDVIDMMALRAHNKGLELTYLINDDVPVHLSGDPGRLKQILINLANNAIKFTEKGEVFINVTLEDKTDSGAAIRFSVQDTGIGIPEDHLGNIFESFSQGDSSMTRKFGGTGLGLSISKQLAEMMDGRVGVESKVGEGSTFWFAVVFEKQQASSIGKVIIPGDINGKKILVVDDSKTNRMILTKQLQSWGCCFDEAEDGKQAIQKIRQAAEANDKFNVAIIDMQMPDMDGQTLGQKIKEDPLIKNTVMVMLTSIGQRGDAAEAKKAGFAAYLSKPVKGSHLFNCLVTLFGKGKGFSDDNDSPELITRFTLKAMAKLKAKILLAEDNIVNQKIVEHLIKKMGFKITSVPNGKEAVNELENRSYDLVLMDVQMPVMDGFEATRIIRDSQSKVQYHDIPIVALTAHAMTGDREKCIEAGMDEYIAKPINTEMLADAISKLLLSKNKN
jgi:signal transduction histidine kinase/PleD family two-component response regulator